MLQAALDGAALHVNSSAPGITDSALEGLINEFRRVKKLITRMSRLYPDDVLERMVYAPRLSEEMLRDQDQVSRWTQDLVASIDVIRSKSNSFAATVAEDTERHLFLPEIIMTSHGIPRHYRFSHDFFQSGEYQALVSLGQTLTGLLEEGAFIQRGERLLPIASFEEGLDWLMIQAKRGYYIQRYKGLGEMNPEQLWETTMDPECRRMLRVTIEDAIAADQMFTTLMGDEVEPRRAFIETNALNVTNLDI
tara:strand:- start:868 stop:1617 length:750 start_codon:yes stop_codon:yes gene_type:complete